MTSKVAARVVALAPSTVEADADLDLDLVGSGVMDSLAFLEFVAAVEDEFHVELDFAALDPERFTTLRGLIEAVEAAGAPVGSEGTRP